MRKCVIVFVYLVLTSSIVFGQGTYYFQSSYAVLAQNKVFFELFNATGSGKKISLGPVYFQKNFAAVTGVPFQMDLYKTTAVGTGGTTLTVYRADNQAPAFPAQITARHAPTGGATAGNPIRSMFYHSEETNQAASFQEALPSWFTLWHSPALIIIGENEGIALKQITATTAGTYSVWVYIQVY